MDHVRRFLGEGRMRRASPVRLVWGYRKMPSGRMTGHTKRSKGEAGVNTFPEDLARPPRPTRSHSPIRDVDRAPGSPDAAISLTMIGEIRQSDVREGFTTEKKV